MLGAQGAEELLLEGADLAHRKLVEVAVDAGVDHRDLLFHLQRLEANFSLDRMIEGTLNVYADLLNRAKT